MLKIGNSHTCSQTLPSKNMSKIAEKMLGQLIIFDMAKSRDMSQYGNQKKMGVNHYLINMIHEILVSVDQNSKLENFEVFCSFLDQKQAFDRQCPRSPIICYEFCEELS